MAVTAGVSWSKQITVQQKTAQSNAAQPTTAQPSTSNTCRVLRKSCSLSANDGSSSGNGFPGAEGKTRAFFPTSHAGQVKFRTASPWVSITVFTAGGVKGGGRWVGHTGTEAVQEPSKSSKISPGTLKHDVTVLSLFSLLPYLFSCSDRGWYAINMASICVSAITNL